MNTNNQSSESGQVLVILMLAIVGLLAFTALAIDGGMYMVDHRGAQNAGDAAVLAGGYRIANSLEDYMMGFNIDYDNWDCSSSSMTTIRELGISDAISQAALNRYPITSTATINGSITTTCAEEDHGLWDDKYVDTTANISSRVRTAFAHFATGGELWHSIDAISRVRPRVPLALGFAIYAHGDGCNTGGNPGGVILDGGGNGGSVTVNNGGILSNSCLIGNGGVSGIVNGGSIGYGAGGSGGYNCNGSGCTVSPAPQIQPEPLPDWALLFPEPDCSVLSNSSSNGDGTISPGIYNGINVSANQALIMQPGLYCFTGNFRATGGSISAQNVTIVMLSGDINIGGNVGPVNFTAPTVATLPIHGIVGMLFYMPDTNESSITLVGNSQSNYTGVIYAEHEDSTIDISGTSNAVFNTQLIAGQVTVGGSAQIIVNFNDGVVYKLPARLTLEK